MNADSDPIAMLDVPQRRLVDLLLESVPADGTTIGNGKLKKELERRLRDEGSAFDEDAYWQVHGVLVEQGVFAKGRGRGGSVRLVEPPRTASGPTGPGSEDSGEDDDFGLETKASDTSAPKTKQSKKRGKSAGSGARNRSKKDEAAQIIAYRHDDKRVNNPEVGMVTPATDPDGAKAQWAFDPHLSPELSFDPQRARIEKLIDDALGSDDIDRMREALAELKRLQSPYLNWTGKSERTSFEIDTVSLHVHERIDPASILSAVRKNMEKEDRDVGRATQPGLFDAPFENLPLRDAIDFYRHERGWANRLIAGDSLLVMNSLLQKESMAGRIQMIYIDPPYGIKYGSNFQPFTNKKPDQTIDKDEDVTVEPEMIRAFRDTWQLGTHSYLTYLRDRLLVSRELLNESGSVFVQISDENLHLVRSLLDEIFGPSNFMSTIAYRTKIPLGTKHLASIYDHIIWYAKDKSSVKFRKLYDLRKSGAGTQFNKVRLPSLMEASLGSIEEDVEELTDDHSLYRATDLVSSGYTESCDFEFSFNGKTYKPKFGKSWKTTEYGVYRAIKARKILHGKNMPSYRFEYRDFPVQEYANVWTSTQGATNKNYVVETSDKVIERCMLMVSDPGDLVLDPTCGGGTTSFIAEKQGRRWITCDTSRIAIALAKQRLMTASYDYFELKYPHEGLKGGFVYKTVPHVTLRSIANNPDIDSIHIRMHPAIKSALSDLIAELSKHPPAKPVLIPEGIRKGERLNLGSKKELDEWEVPFDFPPDWHDALRIPFHALHDARQAMQREMDASIAAHADQETLFDQPKIAKDKLRISGPFTVEAVPFPTVRSLDEPLDYASEEMGADASIARTGESGRQHQWRDELFKTGIRGKGGQLLKFADLEALPTDADIRNLHASGHLDDGKRVVVSFGPEHAALEQRQVSNALTEAGSLFPQPTMIVFCAFTFDPEAAKDIDGIKGIVALKAQMNTDLLTEDLKKARASNQSFWLMGQPEIETRRRDDGSWEVEVHGFDYFDTVKGELVSGGKSKIAMWSLDTDYDDRSLFPRQVFFPMAGKKQGWEKLKASIRAELDESRLDAFHGTVSLPFEAGENRRIAVKIVDDRGIESLKVVALD